MSMDYTVRQVYNDVISRVTQTEADWKAICKLTGQIYRYEFDNILMVYAQRPGATLIADYDTWKKVRRYVKRGSKGIAIFPSRALKPNLRYVFDISDTGGRNVKLTWDLEGDNLSDYLSVLQKRGEIPETGKADRESQLNVLKAFTKREISGIIKEDFGERFAEAVMLTGREITGKENETPEPIAEKLVFNSIFYAVGTRCGFDLSSEELDLGAIVNVRDESCISVLGTLVSDVSCTVLRNMNREITNVERERRMRHGGNGSQLSRESGRTSVSEYQSRGAGESNHAGEIRDYGERVSGEQLSSEVQKPQPVREPLSETERSGGGGRPDDGNANGEVPEQTQAGESGIHDGNVPDTEAGYDGDRGDRPVRDREPVSLETKTELNKELNELNSFRTEREASFKQASLFDYEEIETRDREETEEPVEESEDTPFEAYAIPDEIHQMGVPDAFRFNQKEQEQEFSAKETAAAAAGNYKIDIYNRETGGPKLRYQWNIEAVRTLKKIESEGRRATREEQAIMERYVGWGGIPQAFDKQNESWKKEYEELKGLLSEEEYRDARSTVTTAFYTPPEVAAAVNEALVQFGFQGGNILEPSMGTGHFLELCRNR